MMIKVYVLSFLLLSIDAIRIKTVFRTGSNPMWDTVQSHSNTWNRVIVPRLEAMVQLRQVDDDDGYPPPSTPLPLVCGPGNVEPVESRDFINDAYTMYLYADYEYCSPDVAAFAYICGVQSSQSYYRPVIGYINFCSLDWPTMETLMYHEAIHLLGFSSFFFQLSDFPLFDAFGIIGHEEGAVSFVRRHYGCSTIAGIGTTEEGSHFHPLYVGNEVMLPCVTNQEHRLSEITARVLGDIGMGKDLRFYDINYSVVDPFLYGYQKGCLDVFLPESCDEAQAHDPPTGSILCTSMCISESEDGLAVPNTMEGALFLRSSPSTENYIPPDPYYYYVNWTITSFILVVSFFLCFSFMFFPDVVYFYHVNNGKVEYHRIRVFP